MHRTKPAASHTACRTLYSVLGPGGGGCLMRWTSRVRVLALVPVLFAVAFWLHPASTGPISAPPRNIEPTLPLTLDLRAATLDSGRGEQPSLETVLEAHGDLRDLSLNLVLPQGVRSE